MHIKMNCFIEVLFAVTFLNCFVSIMPQSHRKLSFETAPDCKETTKHKCDFNLFYIRAVGPNDTVHYLWDFTTKPSLLLASTNNNVSLNINWEAFLNNEDNSVTFSANPYYGFLILIDEFIEFEDLSDTGYFSEVAKNISFPADSFLWKYSKPENMDNESDSVSCELIGINNANKNISLSGSATILLSAFGSSSHDKRLPRLLHSSNSTQVKLILQNMKSNASLINSRWAVKFSLISTSPKSEKYEVESKKNLDDENSPGVFTIVNIVTSKPENDSSQSAYLQWRPVIYTSNTPSISNSSNVDIMDLMIVKYPKTELNGTLAGKLFGDKLNNMLIENTIVTFGSSQDGFYKKTNYTSWAFLISYGEPQTESFSKLVILVMSIGLGLPAFLIIVGGIFMCARRLYRRNDELSLEH